MLVRNATAKDMDQMIEIEKICFPKAEAADGETMRRRFAAFPENFLVAVDQEKVVGFINGCTTDRPELPDELYEDTSLHDPNGDYQTIFGLDVLPDYQRQGLAAQLMKKMIVLARERGKKGIVLTCKDHLIAYYEKFGYEHQGRSQSTHGGAVWNDMLLEFKKQE